MTRQSFWYSGRSEESRVFVLLVNELPATFRILNAARGTELKFSQTRKHPLPLRLNHLTLLIKQIRQECRAIAPHPEGSETGLRKTLAMAFLKEISVSADG